MVTESFIYASPAGSIMCAGTTVGDAINNYLLYFITDLHPIPYFGHFISSYYGGVSFKRQLIDLKDGIIDFLPRAKFVDLQQAYMIGVLSHYDYITYPSNVGFIHAFPNWGETCVAYGVWES